MTSEPHKNINTKTKDERNKPHLTHTQIKETDTPVCLLPQISSGQLPCCRTSSPYSLASFPATDNIHNDPQHNLCKTQQTIHTLCATEQTLTATDNTHNDP